jgi:hypothetical protein
LKSKKMNFSIFSGRHSVHIWTPLNHSDQFWRLEWEQIATSKATWRYSTRKMV